MIEVCLPTLGLLREVAVPRREPAPIVKKLMEWREKNKLSQRQAAAVLQRHGCPASYAAVRSWEAGVHPRELMQRRIAEVLEQHPVITDPPRFGRWVRDE